MLPALNWKEIARLIDSLAPEVEGLFVERVIVPERARFPEGFLKNEWALRLTGQRQEKALILSVRPRQTYFTLTPGKGPKAAPSGTRSAFDLALSKHLPGKRLLKVEALPRERVVLFRFQEWTLVLAMIPAVPEALLLEAESKKIVARNRNVKDGPTVYAFPDGAQAPEAPPVREEWARDIRTYTTAVERELKQEAFDLRLRKLQKSVKDLVKQARDRVRQSETALNEAEHEQDWQKFGDLLKASLGNPPPLENGTRRVLDYTQEEETWIDLPCDPKLSPQAQVERFYSLAKRRNRRRDEARSRIDTFTATIARLEGDFVAIEPGNFEALEKAEARLGALTGGRAATTEERKGGKGAWLGKSFVSKDGFTIWVGRSKDENLELTFKHARGNDIWMHVRGRPGAHTLVPTPSGKSVPLETLLDAAVLTVYYSGGENWGKTEVDYTFKKHVKRIRDSTEASYTHNKTLLVEPETARLKRLLGNH